MLGRLFDCHAVVVAFDTTFGCARVVAENMGLSLLADRIGILFSKSESDRNHIHLFLSENEHVDFVLDGDTGGGDHFKNLGIVVYIRN